MTDKNRLKERERQKTIGELFQVVLPFKLFELIPVLLLAAINDINAFTFQLCVV